MTRSAAVVLAAATAIAVPAASTTTSQGSLAAALDAVFAAPALARATTGIRIESLADGTVLYERASGRHVVPASNMKLVTMAVAAERLGWDYRFETRLEARGRIQNGRLEGDLVVIGTGDPTIGSQDVGPSPIFSSWIAALRDAGITRVNGRLIGDDDAFDDEGRGAGWAWDNLAAGYSAPTGALTYNENIVVVRIAPATRAGAAATVTLVPNSLMFDVQADVTTSAADSRSGVSVEVDESAMRVTGQIAVGASPVTRTMAVDDPTAFFVRSLRQALQERGLFVSGGAWDIDAAGRPADEAPREVIAVRQSLPLTHVGGRFMKASQNLYGETLLKSIGRQAAGLGTAENGRQAVRDTLAGWGIPDDAIVMYDGSGLSRYNYVTADAIVAILRRIWSSEEMRGPFLGLLPISGRDGTLASRMQGAESGLLGRVQAKTGTLSHVRALSGFLTADSGEKLVFSMIANHFTAPSAAIDAIMEEALAVVARAR